MNATAEAGKTTHYTVREVVGVFPTAKALEIAVDQLGLAGVNRAAISVLSVNPKRTHRVDEFYRSAQAIADDPKARHAAFASRGSRIEGEVVAIAVPLEIGGFAGAWAIAAAGGALITAIGATVLGGAVGAGLGLLLFRAVARHHAATIESQLTAGGLVLWVCTPDEAAEQQAQQLMQRCGGSSIHAHSVEREWGVADIPLHDVQPDPLLEHEKA
jgi:hypothetical protein